jgi:multiple sugar transport system substrate-binding protein
MPGPMRSHLRWRSWRTLAMVMLVTLVTLCSCAEPAPVANRRPDDGPLTILSGRDQSGGQRQALIAAWNLEHPNRKAKIIELPPIADAQRAEMLARAQSGAGGGVDIYNLDVTWTAEFAEAGYLRQLDEAALTGDGFLDGFLDGPLRTCRYPRTEGADGADEGPLWALPFNADVGLLYYNRSLLGSAQPPSTWDQVAELVQRAQEADPGVTGYVGQYGAYEGLSVTAQELVWGAGGELIDDDGRVVPDAEKFTDGLQRLRAISPGTDRPVDEAASTERFRAGRTLFMRNWPVAYRDLTSDPERPAPDFGVMALPENSGALGGQNLAVSTSTDRYDDAVDLIKFLTADLRQASLYRDGGLPATRAAVYDDDLPLSPILRPALVNAYPRPTLPHYATLSESFRTTVAGFLDSGDLPPTAVLRDRFEAAGQGRIAG